MQNKIESRLKTKIFMIKHIKIKVIALQKLCNVIGHTFMHQYMPEQHLLLREPARARVARVRALARVRAQVTRESAARGQALAARVAPRARPAGGEYIILI